MKAHCVARWKHLDLYAAHNAYSSKCNAKYAGTKLQSIRSKYLLRAISHKRTRRTSARVIIDERRGMTRCAGPLWRTELPRMASVVAGRLRIMFKVLAIVVYEVLILKDK